MEIMDEDRIGKWVLMPEVSAGRVRGRPWLERMDERVLTPEVSGWRVWGRQTLDWMNGAKVALGSIGMTWRLLDNTQKI